LNDIDGIIHFAAYKMVGESVVQPVKYYHNNLVSLINLLLCRNEFNIPHFIFSSSSAVYGNLEDLPVDENTPAVHQESPYGRSKYFGEWMIADAVHEELFYSIILRYFNPVGSHASSLLGEPLEDRPLNIIPAITGTAAGRQDEFVVNGADYPTRDGSCIRDYIHVMDVAEAHTLALQFLVEKKKNGSPSYLDTINLGTGAGISVLEMIAAFEKVTEKKLKYRIGPRRSGDAIAIYSENKKARNVLGWSIRRTLDEIMRSAWEWEKSDSPKVSAFRSLLNVC
jgi:UDP-glucose 4-epimerase